MFFLPLIWISAITSLNLVSATAPSGPWDSFNFAPHSRTVWPKSIVKTVGSVKGSLNLISRSGSTTLSGNQSWLTLDFGIEVGGIISLRFDTVTPSSGLALSFTESPLFISPTTSDDSTMSALNMSYDGVLHVDSPLKSGLWTQPASRLRGGFRFLTLISTSMSPVSFSNLSCAISFMPHMEDLRDYSGYFYTIDPVFHDKNFLTKLWYAGAYTVQTNTLAVDTGRQISLQSPGWQNNAVIGIAGPIIVDGAKRDRTVWPGDMGVAVPTQFVSTNDLLPAKNALATLFSEMNPETGALPYSGPPLNFQGSDTYHAWTIIGVYNYFLYTGDVEWFENVWANYTKAVAFLEGKVDSNVGLMNITGVADWGRLAGGGFSSPGNALLYKVLINSASLAAYLNLTDLSTSYALNASSIKDAFNRVFWSPSLGMYLDNATTTLCPQDGNSLAVWFNLTASTSQADSISEGLTKNWNDIGAITPELPDTIAPFVGSFEIQAHFASGNDARAMDLIRRQWGYMLYTNISVRSTLLEGYTANGSLGYRSYVGYDYDTSYTSHAHGWSTGPTSALTFYVLGLQITSLRGQTWSFEPHYSGLEAAEGGFKTGLGWFGAKWAISTSKKAVDVELEVPQGTEGVVNLGNFAGKLIGKVDGESVERIVSGPFSLGGGKHVIAVYTRSI